MSRWPITFLGMSNGPSARYSLDARIVLVVANTGRTRPGERQVYKDHLRIISTPSTPGWCEPSSQR